MNPKMSTESAAFTLTQSEELSREVIMERHKVTQEDLDRVKLISGSILPQMPQYVERFYQWMAGTPEYEFFFQEPEKLKRVQRGQVSFWEQFFKGVIDDHFLASRRHVGQIHAHIGLSLTAYFSALSFSQDLLFFELYKGDLSPELLKDCIRSCIKLIQLDASLVVESYSKLTNQRFSEQAQAMMEMSTPVTSLWDHILMLPVVGIIDSRRAANMMSSVLHKIAETRAKVFIIDIGGVSVVDTAVANHLIKITQAARLMGCMCLLSGVSPAIAQTTIELGIDVGNVVTRATMRDALDEAFRLIKVKVTDA